MNDQPDHVDHIAASLSGREDVAAQLGLPDFTDELQDCVAIMYCDTCDVFSKHDSVQEAAGIGVENHLDDMAIDGDPDEECQAAVYVVTLLDGRPVAVHADDVVD